MSDGVWSFNKILRTMGFYFVVWLLIAGPLTSALLERMVSSKCLAYAELTGYEVKVIEGPWCMINDPDKGWIKRSFVYK